ncbi:MAG TPA: hypothetical protein PKY95_12340, partial [candidate division Zixibacteria bacterium]|nr:hypothetical protein [candidate division Zixibacteria bacterium]
SNNIPTIVFGDDGRGSFPGAATASRYPFGPEYPFGISIDGAVVTVYPQIVYHGGTALETEQTDVTILADKDWIIIEFDPDASTPAVVVKRWDAASGLPQDHDGLLVRGIWRFALAGEEGAEAASLDRAGWSPGNYRRLLAEDGTYPPPDNDDPPPCGHPGNEPGAGGESGGGDDTEHPGDEPGAGGESGGGDDTDHPGDSPSPPSGGECT